MDASSDPVSAIDFFGTGPTNGAQSSSKVLEEDDDGDEYDMGSECGGSGAGGKRKLKDVGKGVKRKKKKTKSSQVEVEGKGCDCFLH